MKSYLRIIVMLLPLVLGLVSCSKENELESNLSGMWWSLIDQEGILPEQFGGGTYTRIGNAMRFNDDGTGYGATFFFNDGESAPFYVIGGEYLSRLTYTVNGDGLVKLIFDKAYHEYADYYGNLKTVYSDGRIMAFDGRTGFVLEKVGDAMTALIREWDQTFNGGAAADNYNINDEDFTPTTWREQEAIYIYDGTGKDVTDAKGRTGYTLVNMPWYKGDVLTNLPEGFCDDITPGNGWEWVLNRCGSRSIVNNNFFAVYNKYTGILRFFYYLPYGFNAGNDHVWQISMTDHLAQQSVWNYGLPEDRTIVDKAALGQTGDGTFMTYSTPWTNYMSDDGLITPNAGWWAFDVDLSQTRPDAVQPADNLRLQMRSWNTLHTSLSSTMYAAIEGSFAGDLNAEVDLLQTQHLNKSATGIVFKLGSMAGGLGTAIYNFVSPDGDKGKAFGGIVEFAKGGCNLAGIKTEGAHDIDGSIKGKMEGTLTLGLTGNIDTEGTIRGSVPTVGVASPTIYLKDFDLKNSHLGQGVWNLKTPPVVYAISRIYFYQYFNSHLPYFFDPNSIDIQLNPDVFPEDQIEWIRVESVCTSKTARRNDDAVRLAYGLGSYHFDIKTTVINKEPSAGYFYTMDDIVWGLGLFSNTSYSDYLYIADDKLGFEQNRQSFENGLYLIGRCKDGLWLEPAAKSDVSKYRLPYLEVNVVVLVKLKGMDTPVILSRSYLPIMKQYDAEEFQASIQKAGRYRHSDSYDYQMERIEDMLRLFDATLPAAFEDDFKDLVATGGTQTTYDEGYGNLVDGKIATKWCTDKKENGVSFVEFYSKKPITPGKYYMTTANDTKSFPERNPKSWKLMAKAAEGDAWTTIATVSGDKRLPADNYKCVEYSLDITGRQWKYFRFEVSAAQNGSLLQLAELFFGL